MFDKILAIVLAGMFSCGLVYSSFMVYDSSSLAEALCMSREVYILDAQEPEFIPPREPVPMTITAVPLPVQEDPVYEYYQPYTPFYNGRYSENSFKSAGVVYGDDGTRYTWYSQNVLPGGGLTELNANGRHVNDQGYICDGDGYVAVASSDHAIGTVLETPFGSAKVYDTGCASGTVDIYTDF